MARIKNSAKKEIQDGLEEFNRNKIMKRSSLSREEFQNSNNVVLTDKQTLLYKNIRNNILTVVHGPAGTSKTFSTCYTALSLLADKKIEQIIITKPNVESGPAMGFLPGDIHEKTDPYKQSFYTNFCKILDKKTIDFLFATEEIKFEPLNYMRGSTYDNCLMMLDECFTGDTKVVLKHGIGGRYSYLKIKDVVEKFKKGKDIYVSSWNETTKKLESKKVTSVFENGIKETYNLFIKERKKPLKTTLNHPFAIFKDGEIIWQEVSNINKGDILCRYKNNNSNNSTILLNNSYDIILGMCLGDSSLLPNKQSKKSYRIVTNHLLEQYEYMDFKKNIFNEISSYRNSLKSGYTNKPMCGFQTKSVNISDEFYNSLYNENNNKYITDKIERWFSLRTLAIWYMDDGSISKKSGVTTFSTNSMDESEVNTLSKIIKNKYDIDSKIYNTSKGYIIAVNRINSIKMFDLISSYIHPSMKYKLGEYSSDFNESLFKIEYPSNISSIEVNYIEKYEEELVYNIEVEDNNNYFVENILTHNCQNSTISQLMLWSTRLGKDSRAVMMGDTSQYDLKKTQSGYVDFIKMVNGMKDLSLFEFNNEDIVRNKFLIELTNRYDKYRSEKDI